MAPIAVIDTETNWHDQVMSIGCCLADSGSFSCLESRYYVLTPEFRVGGMFSHTLFPEELPQPRICSRGDALRELSAWLRQHGVTCLYAYNAGFDRTHLPELSAFEWRDILRIAAYRQHNPRIPATADCCSTGRLRRGYGVEPMLQLLTGNRGYRESHNALLDAMDELEIMRRLGCPACRYPTI